MAVFESWTGQNGPAERSNAVENLSRVIRRYFQEPSLYVGYGKLMLSQALKSGENAILPLFDLFTTFQSLQ